MAGSNWVPRMNWRCFGVGMNWGCYGVGMVYRISKSDIPTQNSEWKMKWNMERWKGGQGLFFLPSNEYPLFFWHLFSFLLLGFLGVGWHEILCTLLYLSQFLFFFFFSKFILSTCAAWIEILVTQLVFFLGSLLFSCNFKF